MYVLYAAVEGFLGTSSILITRDTAAPKAPVLKELKFLWFSKDAEMGCRSPKNRIISKVKNIMKTIKIGGKESQKRKKKC